MIYRIYSIYDAKAGVFSQPFYAPNRAVAMRSFTDEARNPQSQVNRHPADFALYELGAFNDSEGIMLEVEHHELIVNAASILGSTGA